MKPIAEMTPAEREQAAEKALREIEQRYGVAFHIEDGVEKFNTGGGVMWQMRVRFTLKAIDGWAAPDAAQSYIPSSDLDYQG